jgi:hypothetical protein
MPGEPGRTCQVHNSLLGWARSAILNQPFAMLVSSATCTISLTMSPMPHLKNRFDQVPGNAQRNYRWESPENDVQLTLEFGFGWPSLARIEFSKYHSPEHANDCDHN